MAESKIISYQIKNDTIELLLTYLQSKPYTEVQLAIDYIKQSIKQDELTIVDAASFAALLRYLSLCPWIEVNYLMTILSDTSTEITS